MSDRDLIERVRDSDREAFRALFERYQPVIFRQTFFQMREAESSHDVVQETFLRIWERRFSLEPHLSFLGLALRISGNLVRDAARYRRTRERLKDSVPPPVPSEGDNPEEVLQLTMLTEQLSMLVSELPVKCRTVFLLSRFERMENREIADSLNISVKTVENQINRALRHLRRRLTSFSGSASHGRTE